MSELFKYGDTLSGVRMRAKHIAEEAHYTVGKTLRMYNEQLRDVVSTDVLQSRVT